jgi:hypothetical protein
LRRKVPLRFVEGDKLADIDVADTITVGETEVVIIKMVPYTFQSASSHRFLSGIYESNGPRLGKFLKNLHFIMLHVERDVRHMKKIIGEILFDDVTLVTATYDEVMDPMARIHLHDVPKNRTPTYFYHGLWARIGFFTDPRSDATCQNYSLHHSNLNHVVIVPSAVVDQPRAVIRRGEVD